MKTDTESCLIAFQEGRRDRRRQFQAGAGTGARCAAAEEDQGAAG